MYVYLLCTKIASIVPRRHQLQPKGIAYYVRIKVVQSYGSKRPRKLIICATNHMLCHTSRRYRFLCLNVF